MINCKFNRIYSRNHCKCWIYLELILLISILVIFSIRMCNGSELTTTLIRGLT